MFFFIVAMVLSIKLT